MKPPQATHGPSAAAVRHLRPLAGHAAILKTRTRTKTTFRQLLTFFLWRLKSDPLRRSLAPLAGPKILNELHELVDGCQDDL